MSCVYGSKIRFGDYGLLINYLSSFIYLL